MPSFKQTSFSKGIDLLSEDSKVSFIDSGKYRLGRNIRSRFDVCSPVHESVEDTTPILGGLKQALITFGNYVILFVAGSAYYKLNNVAGWTKIDRFSMSKVAPRYWTVIVPLATTNYGRIADPIPDTTIPSANLPVYQITQFNKIAGSYSNVPGLLVQDGVSQPQFIYIDANGAVQVRVTQTYEQWSFPIDPETYQLTGPDLREYVPVGTYMEWFDGVLFIVDKDFNYIYRSVSGRPLDFVINVTPDGDKGGDATTTSYSIGVNGITAMKAIPNQGLFVAAGGATNVLVTFDKSNVAVKVFGEWTFNRQVLFNANCVTDRGIIDILGDTIFIDATGIRSFTAASKLGNAGRNSIFSEQIQSLFSGVTQSAKTTVSSSGSWCAAVSIDNYSIFSVNTTLGYELIVYDNLSECYVSLDGAQVDYKAVKQFATITIDELAVYCITEDDKLYKLYSSDSYHPAIVRLGCISTQDPKEELKVVNVRAIMSNITEDMSITCSLFVNNHFDTEKTTKLTYNEPSSVYEGVSIGTEIGTQTNNILFSFPNGGQGWKAFPVISWTGGASLVSVSMDANNIKPLQPLQTQAVVSNI